MAAKLEAAITAMINVDFAIQSILPPASSV